LKACGEVYVGLLMVGYQRRRIAGGGGLARGEQTFPGGGHVAPDGDDAEPQWWHLLVAARGILGG
jgi:hypothetical protein